jgi:hypothetical protein
MRHNFAFNAGATMHRIRITIDDALLTSADRRVERSRDHHGNAAEHHDHLHV